MNGNDRPSNALIIAVNQGDRDEYVQHIVQEFCQLFGDTLDEVNLSVEFNPIAVLLEGGIPSLPWMCFYDFTSKGEAQLEGLLIISPKAGAWHPHHVRLAKGRLRHNVDILENLSVGIFTT